jgi:hypothetical protein
MYVDVRGEVEIQLDSRVHDRLEPYGRHEAKPIACSATGGHRGSRQETPQYLDRHDQADSAIERGRQVTCR